MQTEVHEEEEMSQGNLLLFSF